MPHDRMPPTTSAWSASAVPEAGPAPDSVLLERIAAGEQEALEALFARHGARLYALALGILSDATEAGKLLQAVSREVLYETRRFSPTQYPVGRWLADVTRLAALDRLRARASARTA